MTTRSPATSRAVLAVDRAALGSVAQDQVEDRVQVRLRRGQLDALARQARSRARAASPGQRPVCSVRRLQPGDGPGNGARAGSDQVAPVTSRRSRCRSTPCAARRAARALAGHGDEEVEQAVAPVARPVDEQEPAGGRAGQRALGDPRDEGGGEARVDRVAALGEDLRPRLGGQPVARCDRASHREA